jgi:hypothetical protein
MSSCVHEEQNELVVRTGLDLRLRQLDTTKLKKGSYVFVVDGCERFNENMCHVVNTTTKALYDRGIPSDCIHSQMPNIKLYNSILDLPKEDRSKGTIICFNEPSYNGRQCLYHMFGEKLDLKPYQAFVQAMEKVQKDGDAIVFGQEELMWFPGPEEDTNDIGNVNIKKLDIRYHIWTKIYIIGKDTSSTALLKWLIKAQPLTPKQKNSTSPNNFSSFLSIKDAPKRNRSESCIVICYKETSLAGRQALFEQYGEDIAPSFEYFCKVLDEIQKDGSALVLGLEEFFWFPKVHETNIPTEFKDILSSPQLNEKTENNKTTQKTPEFPEDEVHTSYGKSYQLSSDTIHKVIPVAALCGSLKKWVLDTNPKLRYVSMGPMMGVSKGMMWLMWGWEDIPSDYNSNNAPWRHSIVALKRKKSADPDTKARLAEIANTLKTLTEAFEKLAEKLN